MLTLAHVWNDWRRTAPQLPQVLPPPEIPEPHLGQLLWAMMQQIFSLDSRARRLEEDSGGIFLQECSVLR